MKHEHKQFHAQCHICGLPIPNWIVSPRHPLYWTEDHVIPKALGGAKGSSNRKPAHLCCNYRKADKLLTDELRRECMGLALAAFSAIDFPLTKRWRNAFRTARRLVSNDRAVA